MYDYIKFKQSTILITGATGLIGKSLIKTILKENNSTKVIALVRNEEKAKKIFSDNIYNNLEFLIEDVCSIPLVAMNIDYIIHGASQTSSKKFINEPVETIRTALQGTQNMLEIAKLSKVKGFVYLSSMEVYGAPYTDEKIQEQHSFNIDTMSVRSCYPESKRMCENLCTSYASEYNIPIMVVRLTQTFGYGVQYNDDRVFAEFARCVIEGKDITLNTKGETKRSYLYIEDAVSAILTVLFKGKAGEAYNAANEETYCSIYKMACLVAETCAYGKIKVIINEKKDTTNLGYAPILHMNLDTSKLRNLGWKPTTNLESMYKNMINDMVNHRIL